MVKSLVQFSSVLFYRTSLGGRGLGGRWLGRPLASAVAEGGDSLGSRRPEVTKIMFTYVNVTFVDVRHLQWRTTYMPVPPCSAMRVAITLE
jgi:hypothetical protein